MSHRTALDPAAFATEPFAQFAAWLDDARACGEEEPEACALATVGADGAPSLRMVLLRAHDPRGLAFYTNYESRKGHDLAADPRAAMTFYWRAVDRQIRIEGRVERVSAAESDAYFAARPRESRISALASPQSRIIEDRAALEALVREAAARVDGRDVPRPAFWGGYRLVPDTFEFWQAGPHRLHDRLRYRREGDAWRIERLAP